MVKEADLPSAPRQSQPDVRHKSPAGVLQAAWLVVRRHKSPDYLLASAEGYSALHLRPGRFRLPDRPK